MALDRWIALIFVAFCSIYGYAAFFMMDQLLPTSPPPTPRTEFPRGHQRDSCGGGGAPPPGPSSKVQGAHK